MSAISRLFSRRFLAQVPLEDVELIKDHPLAQGLVGLWLLNDGTARDLSGNGNNGSLINGPGVVQGPIGPTLNLNSASTQYVSVPDAPNQDTGSVSFVAWVTATTFPAAAFFFQKGNSSNFAQFAIRNTGKLALYTPNHDYDGSGIYTLTTGQLYCVAATVSSTTLAGYVNGGLDGSTSSSGTGSLSGFALNIGYGGAGGDPWNGTIGPVAFWNRALFAQEIAWLYATPFAMLRPKRRISFGFVPPSGTSVTLSGLSMTLASGSIAARTVVAPGGLSETTGIGASVVKAAVALGGLSETTGIGQLSQASAVTLTNLTEILARGALISGAATTGAAVAVTTALGSPARGETGALSAPSEAVALGAPTPGARDAVPAVAETTALAAPVGSAAVRLAALAQTTALGAPDVQTSSGGSVSLAGVAEALTTAAPLPAATSSIPAATAAMAVGAPAAAGGSVIPATALTAFLGAPTPGAGGSVAGSAEALALGAPVAGVSLAPVALVNGIAVPLTYRLIGMSGVSGTLALAVLSVSGTLDAPAFAWSVDLPADDWSVDLPADSWSVDPPGP